MGYILAAFWVMVIFVSCVDNSNSPGHVPIVQPPPASDQDLGKEEKKAESCHYPGRLTI